MKIIEIEDAKPIKTNTYTLVNYDKFEEFNPVQSAIIPFIDKDNNCVISASTSSGKTVIAEFFISHSVLTQTMKSIYVCPLKALAHEKFSEWHNKTHSYSKKSIAYFTEGSKSQDDFDIGIFTIEGLCHKLMTKPEIFRNVDSIIVDEAHLLGNESRGHTLEFCLIMLSKISFCKIVLLSGTLSNGDEVSAWLCKLTKKPTIYLKSQYRPVPLTIHYRKYDDSYYEDGIPTDLISSVKGLLSRHPEKFLIFVHSKATGKKLKKILENTGHNCDFHCADLKTNDRTKIEDEFKSGKIRVLIATSTLAAGVNLPARRVIVFGVTRGTSFVDKAEITQMMGRAGRKGIDSEGDVYIYIPENKKFFISELKKIDPIRSSILVFDKKEEYYNLSFYLLGLVYNNYCCDLQQIVDFTKETFACQYRKLNLDYLQKTIDRLIAFKFLEVVDNKYKVTKIGALSCNYFIDPYDLFSYQINFYNLVKTNIWKDSLVSYALANIPSFNSTYISNEESSYCLNYKTRIQELLQDKYYESSAIKYGFAYWSMMNGTNIGPLLYLKEPLQKDCGRITSCLAMMSKILGWNKDEYFYTLSKRIIYGVRPELLGLVEIKNIGKIRAELLYSNGFRTKTDIVNNIQKASKVLNLKEDFLLDSCHQTQKTQQDIQS
jgi:helicase